MSLRLSGEILRMLSPPEQLLPNNLHLLTIFKPTIVSYIVQQTKLERDMARREKTIWVVDCAKLGREGEALDRPPFPGEFGKRIFENISKQAWQMWTAQSTIIINHYGLNLADPRAQELLFNEMEQFFFGEGAQMPEGWTPDAAPMGKGAPRRK